MSVMREAYNHVKAQAEEALASGDSLSIEVVMTCLVITILEKLESIDESLKAINAPHMAEEEPELPFISSTHIVCAVCGKRHGLPIEPGWHEFLDISGEMKYFCSMEHMERWKQWREGK